MTVIRSDLIRIRIEYILERLMYRGTLPLFVCSFGCSSGAITVNQPPVLDGVVIAPLEATEASVLQCIPGSVSDINGDETSIQVAWSVNGAPFESGEGTLDGSAFNKGDTVACQATPTDGFVRGASRQSAVAQVVNTPPIAGRVDISPQNPTTDTVLTATDSVTDIDTNDVLTRTYTWVRNGELIEGVGGSTLSGTSGFSQGDRISVRLMVVDDSGASLSLASTVVTVENLAPTVPGIQIAPRKPRAQVSDLLCDVVSQAVDPDGDPVTYVITWTRNGSEYGGPTLSQRRTGDTIPAAQTQDGDRWGCSVVASDGVLIGPKAEAECAVFDTAEPDTAFLGVFEDSQAGYRVSSAGDINNDGYGDVVIGASEVLYSYTGAYILLGGPSGLEKPLSSANGRIVENGVYSGDIIEVSDAGDVNGDGYGDIVLGFPASRAGAISGGAIYVVHGSSRGIGYMNTSDADTRLVGTTSQGLGAFVSGAGDVNADGFDDVLLGAFSRTGSESSGVSLRYGSPDGISDDAFYIGGTQFSAGPTEYIGPASDAGDVNGDGFADLLLSSPGFDSTNGAVYVVHGQATILPSMALEDADTELVGTRGFGAGSAIDGGGDINGDGYADVLIGNGGGFYAPVQGATYVVYGEAAGISDALLNDAQVHILAEEDGTNAGGAISHAGDVDQDGFGDILIGANLDRYNTAGGATYLVSGASLGTGVYSLQAARLRVVGESGAQLGFDVSDAGDVDGDGYADFMGGSKYGNTVSFFYGQGL